MRIKRATAEEFFDTGFSVLPLERHDSLPTSLMLSLFGVSEYQDTAIKARNALSEGKPRRALQLIRTVWQQVSASHDQYNHMTLMIDLARMASAANNVRLAKQYKAGIGQMIRDDSSGRITKGQLLSYADLCADLGDEESAKEVLFERILSGREVRRATIAALCRIGWYYCSRGEPTKALVYYEEGARVAVKLEEYTSYIYTLWLQSDALRELGQYGFAIRVLEKSIRMAKTYGCSHMSDRSKLKIASVYIDIGYKQKAILLAESVTPSLRRSLVPDSWEAIKTFEAERAFASASYSELLDQHAFSKDTYKRTQRIEPRVESLLRTASGFNRLKRYSEAEDICWEALGLTSKTPSRYWKLAQWGLQELATAMEGSHCGDIARRLWAVAEKASSLRVNPALSDPSREALLESISQELQELLNELTISRLRFFRHRGRVVDLDSGQFSVDGKVSKRNLTPTERKILRALIAKRGRFLSSSALALALQEGGDKIPEYAQNIRVHIVHIRQVLDDKLFIETARSQGYRIRS